MSKTRNQCISHYLKPLLHRHFPAQFHVLEVIKLENTLDVEIKYWDGSVRITYEDMRDTCDRRIVNLVHNMIYNQPLEAIEPQFKMVDYFDGWLHGNQILERPLAERLDDAVLAYAQELACETLYKLGKLKEPADSSKAFQALNAIYKEIEQLEGKCN